MTYFRTGLIASALALTVGCDHPKYGEITKRDHKSYVEWADRRTGKRNVYVGCDLYFIEDKTPGKGITDYTVDCGVTSFNQQISEADDVIKKIAAQIESDYNEQEAGKQQR